MATTAPTSAAPITAAVIRSSSLSRPVNAAAAGGSEYRTSNGGSPGRLD
jgi:hypothetical protein